MSARLVPGAMRLGDLVERASQQGATCCPQAELPGDHPMFINRNGRRATIFTSDLDVIVGPDVVEYVETMLDIKII